MNALAIMYVNAHLAELHAQAERDRFAASLVEKRSLRDRLASAANRLRRTLGPVAPGPFIPTLKDYPFGG